MIKESQMTDEELRAQMSAMADRQEKAGPLTPTEAALFGAGLGATGGAIAGLPFTPFAGKKALLGGAALGGLALPAWQAATGKLNPENLKKFHEQSLAQRKQWANEKLSSWKPDDFVGHIALQTFEKTSKFRDARTFEKKASLGLALKGFGSALKSGYQAARPSLQRAGNQLGKATGVKQLSLANKMQKHPKMMSPYRVSQMNALMQQGLKRLGGTAAAGGLGLYGMNKMSGLNKEAVSQEQMKL